MSQSVSYTLKVPIERRDAEGNLVDTITVVNLQRPKGKHMRAMDGAKGGMGRTLALIAACGSLLPSEVDAMDGQDITALGEQIADFLGVKISPPTGET